MRKIIISIISICTILFTFSLGFIYAETPSKRPIKLTKEEQEWIESNKNRVLKVGLHPYSGMDFFDNNGDDEGYLIDIVKLFENKTGLDIEIDKSKAWSEAYQGVLNGSIDILFGANPTEERLKYLTFTKSVYDNKYSVFTLKDSDIYTIGDLDKKKIGFIKDDMIIKLFNENYENIDYDMKTYLDQYDAIVGMINGDIDGFITTGGVMYEYLYQFPQIKHIADIQNVYSEMTFSTRKEDKALTNIMNKIIISNSEYIDKVIHRSNVKYFRKVLCLSEKELKWLEEGHVVRIGIPTDYLPIDHFTSENTYTGIAGEMFSEVANLVGIEVECIPDSFDTLYKQALSNEIDVLNMARSEEREAIFSFTNAFSKERDNIYGLKSSPQVYDIYGLEGSKVAVIKGFWHEDYLKKNLKESEIIYTKDIKESLALIDNHKVDYFIENPSVAEYYIEGLGYTDIVKKGTTSADSFLYFGINKEHEALATIFNKALVLVDYEKAKYRGIEKVPTLKNIKNIRLSMYLIIAIVFLIVGFLVLVKIVRDLANQKAETKILREREHLMYTDPLTNINNRLFFNSLEEKIDQYPYPQAFIMMDLNNLKLTNDTYGHQAGDEIIKSFAKVLQQFSNDKLLIRMGGDEFLIFLYNHDELKIQKLIKQIKDICSSTEISVNENTKIKGPQPSIGYAIRYDASISSEKLLFEADKAMYVDKAKYKKIVYEDFIS
ncbi:transporter substrate-binding domain-containing protein [Wukongibacter baidiensis]|uniref:transporter substrate-binding domain-containing diguanylate cyclase n=1 Tax=Wukongibacter baidiensis TaxID=1723361 RepID=UPI003D7F7620